MTNHRGRVIKTIGDEVLFVADDPVDAARIALGLVEAEDEGFPEVRVGLAYGDVVSRLGDVFGPVVNIASRLTSLARPGRVLLDREMHEVLKPLTDEFRVRRARTATVRGYIRLDTWALKAPKQPKAKPPKREGPGNRGTLCPSTAERRQASARVSRRTQSGSSSRSPYTSRSCCIR